MAERRSEDGLTRRRLLAGAAGAAVVGGLGPAVRASAAAGARIGAGMGGAGGTAAGMAAGGRTAVAVAGIIPQTLPAGPGMPAIIAREVWAQGRCPPRVAPEVGEVLMAFVHHTENPNGYAAGEVPGMLRAIYQFHRYGRDWNDIGYNFVIDRFGRIFEARAGGVDEAVIGAQAGGYNYRSTGIAVLGEYGAVDISPAARVALAQLLAWKLSLHGVPVAGRVTIRVDPSGAVYSRFPGGAHVSLPRVAGHRDADSTDCPGDALYGELPGVRLSAAALAGRVAQLTLALRRAEAGPAPEASPAPAALVGSLTWLAGGAEGASGAPIAGAPIAIQARSASHHGQVVREQTLVQAQTAPDGSFTVPIAQQYPGPPGMTLRALCPGGAGVPAAVSPPLALTGTVSFTSAPVSVTDNP